MCITLHELSHGFVAYKLGDNTAKNAGRLTLNPIKHIDPMGLIMMIAFKFGWAKPVPVNMYNFKNPKRDMAITALAGPISNVIIAAIVLFIYGFTVPSLAKMGNWGYVFAETFLNTAYLSCALAVFNIFPIPPLDGSKVLFSFLSDKAYWKLMRYEKYGMIILLIVVATGVGSPILGRLTSGLFDSLFSLADFSFSLVIK